MTRAGDRLSALADLVPADSRVADVGSDHGRLARLLVASGRASWCVATERSPGPAARLLRALEEAPEKEAIEVRLGDGLAPLAASDRLDVVAVAGLGAAAIAGVLDPERLARLGVRRIVAQPQNGWSRLRRRLVRSGWGVVEEQLVEQRDRWYLVLASEPGPGIPLEHPGLTEEEMLEAGPGLLQSGDPKVGRFFQAQRIREESRLGRLPPGPGRDGTLTRIELLHRVVAAIANTSVG